MTVDMVREWVRLYKSDLEHGYACVQKSEEILLNLQERIDALHRGADILYGRWLKGLE